MITAIYVKTELWNSIIRSLQEYEWVIVYKYDQWDVGIDFNLIILEKDKEEILFGWDNWMEGEIQCSEANMKFVETLAGVEFKKGEPENLKPSIILMYRTDKVILQIKESRFFAFLRKFF
jgi:hypothetical protein